MMVRRLCLSLFLALLFTLPLLGLEEERGEGFVLDSQGAFKLTAPAGWVFDNESSQPHYAAVIYPFGKKWDADDTSVISIDSTSKHGWSLDGIIAVYESSPHQELSHLITSDGRQVRVREFPQEGAGRTARYAYIDTPGSVCRVTLEAPDRAALDRAVPAFEEVIKSFRFFGTDSGEYLANSGARSILRLTTEVQEHFIYGRPEGWSQEQPGKPGVTIFKRADGSAYGIIAIYAAKPSAGSPQADYEAAWKELAQSAFAVGPAPAPQARLQEGCQVRVGQVTVEEDGRQSTVVLNVFSSWGKRTSVLTRSNNSSLASEIENFIQSSFYPYYAIPGVGWSAQNYSRSQDYVDGQLVKLSDEGYASRHYSFGQRTYEFQGEIKLNADQYILLDESGTYSVDGNKLTLVSQGGIQRKFDGSGRAVSTRSLPSGPRTYTYKVVDIEEAIHGPHLVLGDVPENEIDGCYSGVFPNAFLYVRSHSASRHFQPSDK
ncbi:MAG: hypothetical protein U0931_35980 [Vulcanimicrobiota bacterium]